MLDESIREVRLLWHYKSTSLMKEYMLKERQREAKPLLYKYFPLPLIKGKGDTGGWGHQIKTQRR